jgi:hypothetical protein
MSDRHKNFSKAIAQARAISTAAEQARIEAINAEAAIEQRMANAMSESSAGLTAEADRHPGAGPDMSVTAIRHRLNMAIAAAEMNDNRRVVTHSWSDAHHLSAVLSQWERLVADWNKAVDDGRALTVERERLRVALDPLMTGGYPMFEATQYGDVVAVPKAIWQAAQQALTHYFYPPHTMDGDDE